VAIFTGWYAVAGALGNIKEMYGMLLMLLAGMRDLAFVFVESPWSVPPAFFILLCLAWRLEQRLYERRGVREYAPTDRLSVEHMDVLWMFMGRSYPGTSLPIADGPFCPTDRRRLAALNHEPYRVYRCDDCGKSFPFHMDGPKSTVEARAEAEKFIDDQKERRRKVMAY
jgi:hypothetical protein